MRVSRSKGTGRGGGRSYSLLLALLLIMFTKKRWSSKSLPWCEFMHPWLLLLLLLLNLSGCTNTLEPMRSSSWLLLVDLSE